MQRPCPALPRLQEIFAGSIDACGLAVRRLPSGAGHDAVMFSGITDIGMLFVRCGNGGVSHSPRETVGHAAMPISPHAFSSMFSQSGKCLTEQTHGQASY